MQVSKSPEGLGGEGAPGDEVAVDPEDAVPQGVAVGLVAGAVPQEEGAGLVVVSVVVSVVEGVHQEGAVVEVVVSLAESYAC